MERTKRKNVFRAELIIFLAVIVVSLLVLWIRWENSHATYKNYDIVVKKNVYCEKTQTGRVDLQIRRKGGKKAKLLQTQQELKQSQSFQIVEDSYKLGIVDDASAYDGNIYEQKNAGGIQYLTLYYVNHEASGRQGKMHLVMNDAKTGKELINIKTSPKVKKDARRYEYRGKDLYVSEEGILLDAGTDEEFYNSQAMTAGLMTVCWKNGKEKQIQFDPNADVSEYEAADIIIPKVTSTGEEKSEENRCYYALELSDWENIREIKLGENVFAKAENLEKATDDLNKKKKKSKEEKAKEEAEKKAENQKKKEFYTTDMSLLNQPEDFHISDYYITNKVIAGNRYYIDENHVLWGQGMNYYAQLGINHPEDVGNWYHEEYMEPQKIAEHVVHVDASANGYFMMYLTENGELYGAGANLQGILGKEPGENDAMNPQQNVVNQPKLLMSDVSYMRAGATCAVALKKNGEAYWWGEFMSGEASSIYGELGEVRSIYSDSPIINAIFHNKMSVCKEKGIDISCDITGSVKCLDDMGVGSILFNLLDNAIEACEKNKKEKRIICRIAREADEVNIFVENSIEQLVLAENQSLETTKDKKDQHGMGHLIVEEQVKKLGGMVEYYEDEMFCAHVYLPV